MAITALCVGGPKEGKKFAAQYDTLKFVRYNPAAFLEQQEPGYALPKSYTYDLKKYALQQPCCNGCRTVATWHLLVWSGSKASPARVLKRSRHRATFEHIAYDGMRVEGCDRYNALVKQSNRKLLEQL